MPHKKIESNREDEVMRRCRDVRDDLNRRYKTPNELYAWLVSLEQHSGTRHSTKKAKSRAHSKTRPAVRNSKPAQRA